MKTFILLFAILALVACEHEDGTTASSIITPSKGYITCSNHKGEQTHRYKIDHSKSVTKGGYLYLYNEITGVTEKFGYVGGKACIGCDFGPPKDKYICGVEQ